MCAKHIWVSSKASVGNQRCARLRFQFNIHILMKLLSLRQSAIRRLPFFVILTSLLLIFLFADTVVVESDGSKRGIEPQSTLVILYN